MKFSKRKSILAVMLVMAGYGAASAEAQTVVLGGGSSLVGPSIQKEIVDFGGTLTYFTDSSGAGQTAFFLNEANSLVSAGPNGPITASGTVDFANSDAALLAAQVTAYQAGLGATDGPLIQAPYIVTPITVPIVNGPTPTSTTTPQTTPNQLHSIALNDDDLCGIYSGKITSWTGVINPDTVTLSNPAGTAYTGPSGTIDVVYRSDNSGTTELLTRHLSQVCHTTSFTRVVQGAGGPGTTTVITVPANSNVSFADGQGFAANFTAVPLPANFIPESGSGGIRNELTVLQTAGTPAIAYLSPDWTNTFLAPSSPSASPALAVASLRNDLLQVSAPAGTFADIPPTAAQADNALATDTPPDASTAADPTQWAPVSGPAYLSLANPTTGYPVSGTSQIVVSQCYASSADATALTNFLLDHYTNAEFISVVRNNGFDVPAAFVSAIQSNFLSNTSGNFLDIQDADICGPASEGLFPGR